MAHVYYNASKCPSIYEYLLRIQYTMNNKIHPCICKHIKKNFSDLLNNYLINCDSTMVKNSQNSCLLLGKIIFISLS